jgi:ribosomal protein S18 acetylase RimI-like enzyme
MSESIVKIRLMKSEDFEAVVVIDEKVFKVSRPEYYKTRFEKLVNSKDYVPTSLVAETETGMIVGFVMGELYIGEYGISENRASLDTIGVDPDFQNRGIGEQLINEFLYHLRKLGIDKVYTLVDWDDTVLLRFFSANKFSPSKTINLERSI